MQCDRSEAPVWTTQETRRLLEDVLDHCLEVLSDADVPLWHHKAPAALRGAHAAAHQLQRLGVVPKTPEDAVTTAQVALRLTLADRTFVRLVVANPADGLRVL